MSAPSSPPARRPASDVSSWVGVAGLATLLGWIAFARLWPALVVAFDLPAPAEPLSGPNSALLAIARSTGRARWVTQLARWRSPKKETGPIFWTGPVLASNRLWVASSRGEVQSVDVMTGEAAPFTELNDSVSLPPVVANNTLYILDDGGRITAWR